MFEITVKVSDGEITLTERFLHYDPNITLSHSDPILGGIIQGVVDKFQGLDKPDVSIRIKGGW